MNKTVVLISGIVIMIVLAVGVSFWVRNMQNAPAMQQIQTNDQTEVTVPSVTPIPVVVSPTFTPIKVSDTVKSISNDKIIVTGKTGDMTLPKDDSKVDVFINSPTGRTQATFDDVKVGQQVSVHIIIPGKKAELIIEQ